MTAPDRLPGRPPDLPPDRPPDLPPDGGATSPRRNRVLPTGLIVADPARGLFTGNRGILVRPDGTMSDRQWAAMAWITCVLDWDGRRRAVAQPRTWTELFFLDEAVALAAGHRPCGYCRREAWRRFKALWGGDSAVAIDRALHAQRLDRGAKRLHRVDLAALPDGAFCLWNDAPHLVDGNCLLPYTPSGYGPALRRPSGPVAGLTPPGTLAVLAAGYRPHLHPTARP